MATNDFALLAVEDTGAGLALKRKDSSEIFVESASPVISAASGDTAVIPDAAEGRLFHSVLAGVDPVQDLNGYDSPWPAGGGKNLWPEYASETKNGVTIANDHGKLTINSENAENDVYFDIEVNYSVTAGQKIVVAGFNPVASPSSRLSLFAVTSTQTGNPQKNLDSVNAMFTDTANNDTQLVKLRLRVPAGETYTNFVLYPYLQIGGDTPTAWSPYSNICPITGWTGAKVTRTGKNLLDDTGMSVTNTNLKYSVTGATGNGILLKKGASYTVSCNGTGVVSGIYIRPKNANGTLAVAYNKTFLTYIPEKDVEVGFDFYWANASRPSDATHLQLELGSIATAYEPYAGNTYDVSWQSEAGIVYGGTLDVTNGVLTVDHAFKQFDGTETWAKGTTSGSMYFYSHIGELNSGVNDYGICSHFVAADVRGVTSDIGQRVVNSSGGDFRLCVRPADYASATPATFKSWVAEQAQNGTPLQIAWTLTEPLTYLIDPIRIETVEGVNIVWADCGPVTVEYIQDTGAAIAAGDADTRAMTAPDAPGYIAGRNFTAGEFLTVGAKLYRVTANIANGGTVTPGENVTETTVGEQLAALWAALNT